MPIKISYSPVGEMAQLAFEAGRGKYRQQQQQVQLQMAEMAMRDQAQQRAIQANLLSQSIANQQRSQAAQQEMAFRAAMGQQQFAQQAALQQQQNDAYMQRAEFQRQEMLKQTNLQGQYGMFRGAMDAIYDLEAKGAQYTPEQQRYVSELDAARQKALIDENLDDQGKQLAELQYWQKRSRVTPTQPPPKTKQQLLDESVAIYEFPDGTQVPGVMGERNGVPVFNAIEKPEDQEAKLLLQQEQFEQKLQMQQAQAAEKAKLQGQKEDEKRKSTMLGAWDKTQQAILKVEQDENVPNKEAVKQQLLQNFSDLYWQDAVKYAPIIAERLGIEELEELGPVEESLENDLIEEEALEKKSQKLQHDFFVRTGGIQGGIALIGLIDDPLLEGDERASLHRAKAKMAGLKDEEIDRYIAEYQAIDQRQTELFHKNKRAKLDREWRSLGQDPPAQSAPAEPPATREALPPPVQVAQQRGVTPALLQQREATLLAKPRELWTDEDQKMYDAIQRLKAAGVSPTAPPAQSSPASRPWRPQRGERGRPTRG